MIFAAPWVLLALPALPLLWWLLRVTPPAPRSEIVPRDPPAAGSARPRGNAGAHALVAAAAAHGRRDAGDRRAGAPGAGRRLHACRDRPGAAGGRQRLGLRRRLAAPHAGGEQRAGSRRTRRPPGRAAGHRAATARMPRRGRRHRCRSPICAPRLAALRPKPWPPDRAAAAHGTADRTLARCGGGLPRRRADRRRRLRAFAAALAASGR